MRYLPCDELASNLRDAEEKWECRLYLDAAEEMIRYVASHYGSSEFETLLERTLDLHFVAEERERHAYKMAFGLFFNTRAQYRRDQLKEMDAIPFAPR